MVNPETAEGIAETFVSVLPPEIAAQLVVAVRTIGGLFVLYLIFLAVRIYLQRKQTKAIENMKEDIEKIKKKLKIRKKK